MWQKIYFDLDNTLFSYEYAFQHAIKDTYLELLEQWEAANLSVPIVPLDDWCEVFKYFSDVYWEDYQNKAISQRDYRRKRYMETMRHFQLPCSPEEADQFHNRAYERALDYVQPYPGLYPLLQCLVDHQFEVGVITNGHAYIQRRKCRKLGLEHYIPDHHIYISEEIGLVKPDPAFFRLVQGPCCPPEAALFIGDAWEHDVVGALEAGWQAVYLNTQNRPRTTSHRPLAEFQHLYQFYQFIQDFLCSTSRTNNRSGKEGNEA
ncbi:haloacid dehalogenase [Caldalkalibacillus thermarum]|uniref:HAD family hydrolase n=1 Tax=Caldalkalibacillus thermarum TaxID=296745 RepID=UPI00166C3EA6|nr:HAD family hydrolase [Caldalkalibacillus thermarum]GGK20475.1 haloacid dehalogenase [Caldalkalibacillus thermarum]